VSRYSFECPDTDVFMSVYAVSKSVISRERQCIYCAYVRAQCIYCVYVRALCINRRCAEMCKIHTVDVPFKIHIGHKYFTHQIEKNHKWGLCQNQTKNLLLWLHKQYIHSIFKLNNIFLQSVLRVCFCIYFMRHEKREKP
jgi:hypothetical protein